MTADKPNRAAKKRAALKDGQEAARILDDPHFKDFMQRYEDFLLAQMLRTETTDIEAVRDLHYRMKAARGLKERLRRYVVTMNFEQSMTEEQ